MALKLGKVSRGPHLPTLVASSISREIAQGRLKPGDQLPTEQGLAATFGVSRSVVREAIARLRSEGLVWSQQGRGAFVTQTTPTTVLTIDPDSRQSGDAFEDLFEMRSILEVRAAGLAAARRLPQDMEHMREVVATMSVAAYGSIQWLKTDLGFHIAVANATRNGYIVQALEIVSERVRESILAAGNRTPSEEMAQATLAEHGRILAAIEAGDTQRAEEAMRLHLAGAARRVRLDPS